MIAVVIVLIIVILLMCFKITKIRGGDDRKLTTDDAYKIDMSPSASQVVISNEIDKARSKQISTDEFISPCMNSFTIFRINDTEELLKRTTTYLSARNHETYNGYKSIINIENYNKYISDAHIDALLIADNSKRIFAVCEYTTPGTSKPRTDPRYSYGSKIITMISPTVIEERNLVLRKSIVKPDIDSTADFNFNYNRETQLRLSHIYKYKDKEVCNTLVPIMLYFDRSYKLEETIATEIAYPVTDIKVNDKCILNVFVEFVYNNLKDISIAYSTIHLTTSKVLRSIFSLFTKDHTIKLAVVRILVKDDGSIDNDIELKCENQLIYFNNASGFNYISVPSTKSSFEYDEYLEVQRKISEFYKIQIEHSEKLSKHKSNLVEFVLRNSNDAEFIKQVLSKFGYLLHNGKYITKEEGTDRVIKLPTDSIIYKANESFCRTYMNIK